MKLYTGFFFFWTQYGQKPLSTPITMYETDLPTLPIFGQHLRVFPYQIHIHLSHFWLAGMIHVMTLIRERELTTKHNAVCYTNRGRCVNKSHTTVLHDACVNRG